MAKEAYYFSHDANARNDEKILMLRAEHGMEGYGIYWVLLEMMFESSDTKLFHSKTKGIAVSCNVDITLLQSVINTSITEGLFASDGEKFWSESLMRRKNKFHEAREKKSLAGKKGMAKRWGNKDLDNTVITNDNTAITENNKGKESKSKVNKNIKEKDTKKKKGEGVEKIQFAEFVHLKQNEYDELVNRFGENGARDIITILDNYKGSSGKKYVSDYRAMSSWVIKRYEEEQSKLLTVRKQSSFDVFEEMRKEIGDDEQRPSVINHPINNNVLPKL